MFYKYFVNTAKETEKCHFLKCINDTLENLLEKGKIYEVMDGNRSEYKINIEGRNACFIKSRFEEVKQEETKFRFIPKSEITEVIVDGIEGVLIKE